MTGGVTGTVVVPGGDGTVLDGQMLVSNPVGLADFKVSLKFSGSPTDGVVKFTNFSPNNVTLLNPGSVEDDEISFLAGNPSVHPIFSVPYGSQVTGVSFSAVPICSGVTGSAQPMTQALRWIDLNYLPPAITVGNYQEGDVPTLNISDAQAYGIVSGIVQDMSGAPVSGAAVRMGAPNDPFLGSFVLNDINGQVITPDSTLDGHSPSVTVKSDGNGVAGFSIHRSGHNTHVFSTFQINGPGKYITTPQAGAALVVADLKTDLAVLGFSPVSAPSIQGAEGNKYDPSKSKTGYCNIQITAGWANPTPADQIIIVVNNRPRAIFTIEDYADDNFPKNNIIVYPLQVQQLFSGNSVTIRYLVIKDTLGGAIYSSVETYKIAALPAPGPVTTGTVCPAPRLFPRKLDASGNATLGDEIDTGLDYIVGWGDINEGGIYAYMPYNATSPVSGASGPVTMTVYLSGVRPGVSENVIYTSVPYYPVNVNDVPVTPNMTPKGETLANGALTLISTDVLRWWESDLNGDYNPFSVQYIDVSGNPSISWTNLIDTTPISGT